MLMARRTPSYLICLYILFGGISIADRSQGQPSPAPKITAITPTDHDLHPFALFGQVMTIDGENFSTVAGSNHVLIGKKPITPSIEPTIFKDLAPQSATTNRLQVTVPVLPQGRGDYDVWVRTTQLSNPIGVFFDNPPEVRVSI